MQREMAARPPIEPPAIAAFEGPLLEPDGGGGARTDGRGFGVGVEVATGGLHAGGPNSTRFEDWDCWLADSVNC